MRLRTAAQRSLRPLVVTPRARTMSTTTKPYVLSEIVLREDAPEWPSHSMFVNRTKSDLAILGIPYTRDPLTFGTIRGDLATKTGLKDVTVPTIEYAPGEYVTDSWTIAEWLEKNHGTPTNTLFPAGSNPFARFLKRWVDEELVLEIRELFRPLFYTYQDAESAEYFLRVKYGNDSALLNGQIERLGSKAEVAKLGVRGRAKLRTLENYLADAPAGGPFFLGDKPTHADSIVFGWYLCSQVNAPVVNAELWENDELPRIKAWVGEMKKATGLDLSKQWTPKVVPK
ncbi:uncharacterized protein LOC62_05G006915 [Vanrija pseudolonga]|uniref:Glutathione S-transferase UstS-like C-terminal domain-containing protein n=1 Tax=Vanrija pseudolonga TaxID=143232 RepID=A0AAF0YEG2_9TREE|nr:hypothetical protein LOC62_05G006915 [Vanrija pseudolonga]